MSRNFELLRQAGKEQDLLRTSAEIAASTPRNNGRLDLESLTREEVMKLVQQVFLVPSRGEGPRTVLFSGVGHGDGCSWACARAGEALASQGGRSVCLVDANLRSPSLHEYFGVNNLNGLTEATFEDGPLQDFVQKLIPDNLCLVPSGSRASDLHTMLASDRLRSRITELRTKFDHVLIDAPPLGLYADAILLGQLTDGVILVVGANSTRRETARKAKESLEAAQVRLLGAVLNRRTFAIPEALYRKVLG